MATNVQTETFEGTPSGSNLALPQQELDDTEARQIMDGLVDYPGKERQRGPVAPVGGLPTFDLQGSGLVMTLNPQGTARFGAITGDASHGYLEVLSSDLSSKVQLAWPFNLPVSPYFIVDAKPALGGGLMIGISSAYDASNPSAGLAHWYGGNKANFTTGATALTVSRGSAAVAGTGFLANVAPGMFLFANTDEGYSMALIGVVLQVNSDTSLTLMKVSPYAITGKQGTFQSIRGIAPKVTTGRITADTNSTTVSGGNTKFISQGLNVGTWQLYRQSDGAFVGKVASVTTETSLTLTANATVAAANEEYIAVRADADFGIVNTASINKVGFLNATYADRQWFANIGSTFQKTSRLWFSDTSDPEGLDLSDFDGNWFDVTSSSTVNEPIRSIAPAYNGLVVHKENETFVVTGTSPEDFTVRKLEDDGTLSGMSVQQYAGGVIWAGREGIHFYDGIQTQNLVSDKLGDYYKNTIRTFDPTTKRMWSMVNRDHYWLFIESVAPTVPIVKGVVSTTPTKYAIVINLATRAITFAENVDIRGSITLPASAGKHSWFLVNGRLAGDSVTRNVGKTAVGGTVTTSLSADRKRGSSFVLTENGTLTQLSVYINPSANVGATQPWKLLVYSDNAGNPDKLIATSVERTVRQSDPAGWYTFDIPDVAVAAGTYWFDIFTGANSGTAPGGYVYDTVVGADKEGTDTYADGPSDPYGAVVQTQDRQLSIYATYIPDHAIICDGEALFNQTGVDAVTCAGSSAPGPSYFWESKKFNAGDSVRLKNFKLFLMYGLVQGGDMKIDIVLGLNDVGETLVKTFPASVYTWTTLRQVVPTWTALKMQFATWTELVQSVFIARRFKFSKRSTHISFRVYAATNTVTRLEQGPFKIGYKLLRDGRI